MNASIRIPGAGQFIRWFVAHLEDEEVRPQWIAPQGSMRFELEQVGSVCMLLVGEASIDCTLDAVNPRMEHLMRLSLAEHLQQFAEMEGLAESAWVVQWHEPVQVAEGRSDDNGKEGLEKPAVHVMRVLANTALTPCMRRLTLQAGDIDDVKAFAQGGLHVRMLMPQEGEVPHWPDMDGDGRLHWPAGAEPLARRTYTIRSLNEQEGILDIDVLLHGVEDLGAIDQGTVDHGVKRHVAPGSDWARGACAGSEVAVLSPAGGRMPTARRLVIVADACAVPAAARIIESMDAGQQASVLCWVASGEERHVLPAALQSRVDWICAGVPGASEQEIAKVLQWLDAQDWSEPGNVELWAAGGHAMAAAIRQWARNAASMQGVRKLVSSYWR